ncbi:hypothetical protein BJ508DRAFT_306394 [Ascobolus immersus RN42]|uniref:Uncharacterized protein n=1 Tax=Ascobolus immersus RN42 TaxID=1160509 RepID=A0A3N4IBN1_ASCIM|nr:hypothetical protein BJ508DRAFT_306394 [Ascobolus immersus RN42]
MTWQHAESREKVVTAADGQCVMMEIQGHTQWNLHVRADENVTEEIWHDLKVGCELSQASVVPRNTVDDAGITRNIETKRKIMGGTEHSGVIDASHGYGNWIADGTNVGKVLAEETLTDQRHAATRIQTRPMDNGERQVEGDWDFHIILTRHHCTGRKERGCSHNGTG